MEHTLSKREIEDLKSTMWANFRGGDADQNTIAKLVSYVEQRLANEKADALHWGTADPIPPRPWKIVSGGYAGVEIADANESSSIGTFIGDPDIAQFIVDRVNAGEPSRFHRVNVTVDGQIDLHNSGQIFTAHGKEVSVEYMDDEIIIKITK